MTDTPFGQTHPFKPGTAGQLCAECGWPCEHWLHNVPKIALTQEFVDRVTSDPTDDGPNTIP